MDVLKDANEQLAKALPFTMIVLFQGLAAGNAIKLPSVLTDKDEILDSPIVRRSPCAHCRTFRRGSPHIVRCLA